LCRTWRVSGAACPRPSARGGYLRA
jgi:hypothetical protein